MVMNYRYWRAFARYYRTQLLLVLVVSFTVSACGVNTSPGDTEKVGQIVKVSKVGLVNKTWEAELVRGGFSNGGGVNGQAYDFTIESDSLAAVAKSYMESQREVKVRARHEALWSVARSESDGHFATSVDTTVTKK
jgi:predicted small secreted protein